MTVSWLCRCETHFDPPTLATVTALAAKGALRLDVGPCDVVPIAEAVRVYDRLRDDPLSVGCTVFDWTSGVGAIDGNPASV